MIAPSEHDNGRVTLAVISTKLDTIIEHLAKLDACNDRQDERLRLLEQGQSVRQTQITGIQEDIKDQGEQLDDLRKRDFWSGGIGGLLAFIGSMIIQSIKGP